MTDKSEISTAQGASYRAYLQTGEWRHRRNAALRRARYRCSICGSRRALQVHHLSYERLGRELDIDLQVLCAGCHEDQHPKEAEHDYVRLYVVVAEEVVAHFGRFESVSDFSEALKVSCARLKIPYNADKLARAIRIAYQKHPDMYRLPPVQQAYIDQQEQLPASQDEARLVLRNIGFYDVLRERPMPDVRPMTLRQAEVLRAQKLIAAAIVESVERCEALEAELDADRQS